MTRMMMIVGFIAALVLTIGGPGFTISPAGAAEMMQADMAMMKATGTDLMSLKQEIAGIRAELERLSMRAGSMAKMVDSAASNYCASVPDALLVSGFAPGLCK